MDPLVDPMDLAARLGVTTFTPTEEARAEALLLDASATVRNYIRQQITVGTDTAVLEATAEQWLWLPERPVLTVSSVRIGSAVISPVYWVAQGDGLYRFHGWQGRFGASTSLWNQPDTISVTYTHGYTSVPDDIVGVVCKLAQTTWLNPQMLRSFTQGDMTATLANETIGVGNLNADDKRILDFYRRPRRSVQLSAGLL